MENLILSFNVVFPLFLLMAAGYLTRRLGLYDDRALRTMNNLVFRVFLPVLIFKNVINSSFEHMNINVLLYAALGLLLAFGLAFLVVPLLEKEPRKRGVLIQGICRSNFVLYGIPVVSSLFGDEGGMVASLLVAVTIPLYNALSVAALEVHRGGRVQPQKILLSIAKNPLIIATVLGLLVLASGLKFPTVGNTFINDLSKVATPLALFLLGGSFEFSAVGKNWKQLLIGVSGKLIWNPLIFVTGAILMGFRNAELAGLMIVFMAPTAVNSYTMAQQMGGDDELAGQQVVFSSLFSVVTVFLWIFVCKQMGLL